MNAVHRTLLALSALAWLALERPAHGAAAPTPLGQGAVQDPVQDEAPVEAPAEAPLDPPANASSEAQELLPPPSPAEGVASVLGLIEAGELEEARATARDLAAREAALDATDPARWSERDRALLDHAAALAAGALAEALFESEAPDWERIEALEDEGAEAFERALSASARARGADRARFDALRRRAAYGAGTLLAHGAERTVRRAQRLALMQPQEVPFAEDTPERELVDGAHARFERARDALLVRLELDWTDADTRANLEWVQRRLFEIERLRERADEEQERREQEQEEQQQESEDEQDDEQESEDEQDESSDDGEEDGEQEQDDASSDDASSDEASEDGQQPDEDFDDAQEGDDGASEEELAEEAPGEASDEQQDGEASAEETEGQALESVEMSDVELRRLLQRLAEIDREGEETRRRLAASMRRRVERDW